MSLHDLHEIGSLQITATPKGSGNLGSTWKCVVLFFKIFLAVLIQVYINENI